MKWDAVEDFRVQMLRARMPQAQNQTQSRTKRRNGLLQRICGPRDGIPETGQNQLFESKVDGNGSAFLREG